MSANHILATTIAIAVSALAISSAQATNGRQAVGMCIDQKGCVYGVGKDGKNIDIIAADGTYIHCADVDSECTIPRKIKKSRTGTGMGTTAGTSTQ
jgi:hypothetical protein